MTRITLTLGSLAVVLLSHIHALSPGSQGGEKAAAAAPPISAEAAEFFETHVRPALAEHCFACHGPSKQKAGLRLDSRETLLKGSETGAVIVPGDPEKSRLIQAIRYAGDIKMPPKEKLADKAIEALTAWVKMGAPWPEKAATGKPEAGGGSDAGKNHWAFQTVRQSLPPLTKGWTEGGSASPIDHFIAAKLEANGLSPSKPADRRTLIRRATFDLIGLPPTPQEIEAFQSDSSPDAFVKVVERLLASPHYGERWGRHWLDVARYADTKGYLPGNVEQRYLYAYTYRDYVVRAFNEDLPYDQFILQQLAADRLPLGDNKSSLAAMGFLTLGRRFLNNPHDIIDDRIDVVTRGLLGLTVSCARCHDHKFDPIPTKDYYSLHGIFASSVEPNDLPLLVAPGESESYRAYEKEVREKEQEVERFLATKHQELLKHVRSRVADYLLGVRDAQRLPGEEQYELQGPLNLNRKIIERWQAYLNETRQAHHPIFAPWHAFAAIPQKDFATQAPAALPKITMDSDKPLNPLVAKAFAEATLQSLRDVAMVYETLLVDVDKRWQESQAAGNGIAPATTLPDPDVEAMRQVLYGPRSPAHIPKEEAERFVERNVRDQLVAMRKKVDQFKADSPNAPPRAMVLQDASTPTNPHVFIRGNPGNRGEAVPRQFLSVLAGDARHPFKQGSGRLDLAQAIADKNNPLTARVMVNRIWLHHFGEGLVRTPSDFGTRGEPPTHPELLDYLAWRFMQDGWSIKKMHRLIMLSSVYQQSSEDHPRHQQIDPENRLLWKMNRRRLDFEAMRDSLLAASGALDTTVGGRPANLTPPVSPPSKGGEKGWSTRRTIYGFIDRQNLPGLLRSFDFASPDTTNPQRHHTTVPQQALFLMNSPFVVEQARKLVGRADFTALTDSPQRIQHLYRLLYGRAADREEESLGLQYVEGAETALNAWERYAQVLLLANEFVFVD